jgi:hypothetical protein
MTDTQAKPLSTATPLFFSTPPRSFRYLPLRHRAHFARELIEILMHEEKHLLLDDSYRIGTRVQRMLAAAISQRVTPQFLANFSAYLSLRHNR